MDFFIKPAILLSNSLRFKAKFILLATVFYLPFLACCLWIINGQFEHIKQYHDELAGHQQIQKIVQLEQAISAAQQDNTQLSVVSDKIAALKLQILSTNVYQQTAPLANKIADDWQQLRQNSDDISQENYAMIYDETLALRENVAALSGLTRESKASAFYLAELTVQRLPALLEYIARIRFLSAKIIENDGFDAQTYTLLVSLDKRIDELQIQLQKTTDQFVRVAPELAQNYQQKYISLTQSIDNYQKTLHQEVIEPDSISLPIAQAQRLSTAQYQQVQSLLNQSQQVLSVQLSRYVSESDWWLYALIFLLIAVTILTSLLLLGIYYSLKSNVQAINHAASLLGEGDFSQTLKVHGCDELADIAINFVQMQNKILVLLQQFENDVVQLKSASGGIQQLTQSMEESLLTQQNSTHQVASSVTQMTESILLIGHNTDEASQLTGVAQNHVDNGQAIISTTAMVINDISAEVNGAAQVINELAKNSKDIGQFIDVISEIADQTNLLALNAAIEAARAGEQGRGFAVVADEVRTLAGRTQGATVEIQRIIGQLQVGASRSVEVMNQGVSKAEQGVVQVKEVSSSFQEVTDNVHQIVSATSEISTAVNEQTQMVKNIDVSTETISQGADQVLQGAKEAAASGQNLLVLADGLAKQLAQFKLS